MSNALYDKYIPALRGKSMYATDDPRPRGGVSAYFITPTGNRTVTLRETNPEAAIKEAREIQEEGHILVKIHERGLPSSILWTPQDGWIQGADEILKKAAR